MKILYLAHRIPYPPNKGDKIRSFHEIRVLSKHHEIHLACLADDPADLEHRTALMSYCKRVATVPLHKTRAKLKGLSSLLFGNSISTGYFYSRSLQKTVNEWLKAERYEAVICFSSPMAEYLFRSPSLRKSINPTNPTNLTNSTNPVLLMDFCDVDSDKWRQYAQETRFPMRFFYSLESRRLLQYETRVNQAFHHSVFVSQPETELFKGLCPDAKNVHTVPNGVDYEYFSPDYAEPNKPNKPNEPNELNKLNKPNLVFTGAMDYHANVDGVLWFANEVFPGILDHYPEALFYIVGSKPAPQVKELAQRPGIHITGFVDDVRPYYKKADVCVIPLRLARGVQNKVLEAMSMGRPVVATSRANQGILADSGKHLMIEDTPTGFQHTVLSLLAYREKAESLGWRAREYVRENYDWDRNMSGLEAMLVWRPDR